MVTVPDAADPVLEPANATNTPTAARTAPAVATLLLLITVLLR
jgi:hypothetical protein